MKYPITEQAKPPGAAQRSAPPWRGTDCLYQAGPAPRLQEPSAWGSGCSGGGTPGAEGYCPVLGK